MALGWATLILTNLLVVSVAFYVTFESLPFLMHHFKDLNDGDLPNYEVSWIQRQVMESKQEYSNSDKFPTAGEMKVLWQTSILQLQLAKLHSQIDLISFNSKLATVALTEYGNLLENNKKILSKDGAEINDANQVFFEWQAKGGWKVLQRSGDGEVLALERYIQHAVDKYLKSMHLPDEIIEKRSRVLEIWATVHEPGVSHLPHTHRNSLVSGVYYVKIPKEAGSIIFSDPRGPLYPFNNTVDIKPDIGDLILFPSWLVHQVSPTFGKSDRISIAFNVPGDWDSTSQISEFYPLQI